MKNRHSKIIAMLIILLTSVVSSAQGNNEITPPKKIYYDNLRLNYNPSWKDEEIYIADNLDNDPEDEVIISFVATYKPLSERRENNKPMVLAMKDQEIPIIHNYIFYQIFDKGLDGYYNLIKTITGMDQMGKIKILTLDDLGPKAIAIFNYGGKTYTDLSIYRFQEGGYRLIFNRGANADITISDDNSAVEIYIQQDEKNRKVYFWNSGTGKFELKEKDR